MKDYTGRDEVIFQQALLLPAVERPAYLATACGEDAELRRRVESRLRAHDEQSLAPKITTPAADDDEWPSAIPRPAVVGQKVGPYKLIEELGEGGGGLVFLAEQESPVRRRVALKIIKLGMDTEDVIARFEAERQALAMMDHPNIARVFDAGATPTGRPYFVMELVRGVPITQFCDDNQLTVGERLKLFVQVCNAVQHAHQKGIIHRDLKPSNILVAMHDGTPMPKIIDFGISKATGGRLTDKTYYTTHDQFVGTPAYMSPEQAEMTNLDVDTRSDIYSLGVLLYQLLAGCTPLDAHELRDAGIDEVRRRIREEEPRRPSARLAELCEPELADTARARGVNPPELISQVRGDLDWIVMHCVEKDRQRRYESASALAQDIQRHLANEPVFARPPSTWYSLQKMMRRHRVMFAAASAVAAALVLGLGAATWSYYNERQSRRIAETEKTRADEQAGIAREQMALARAAESAAEQQKHEVQLALSRADYLMAVNYAADDKYPEAVAHLVRALRATPADRAAAALLCSILTTRDWLLPGPVAKADPVPLRGGPRGTRGQQGQRGNNAPGGRRIGPGGGGLGQNFNLAPPGQRGQTNLRQITSADGQRTLQSTRRAVRVLDAASNWTSPSIETESAFRDVDLSPDGRRIVTASMDRVVRVWDVDSAGQVSQPVFISGEIRSVRFAPDGKSIVIQSVESDPEASNRRDVTQTWSAAGNISILFELREAGPITSLGLSSDESRLLTVAGESVRMWNALTGQPLGEAIKLDQPVTAAALSRDAKLILTMAQNNHVKIWEAATGRLVSSITLPEPRPVGGRGGPPPVMASFSPDATRLLAAFERIVQIFDTTTGASAMEPLRLDARVNSASYSPDGNRILTAGTSAQIWNAATGAPELEFAKESGIVNSASYSPDGKLAVTTTQSGLAQVWDVSTGQAVSEVISPGDVAFAAGFSPDSRQLLTFSRAIERTARVWDAATGLPVSAVIKAGSGPEGAAAFSADGQWVLTVVSARGARVWDADTGLPVSVMMPAAAANLDTLAQRLFVLGGDGVARAWPFTDRIGPEWILDLAETLARCRLDSTGSLVVYEGRPIEELRRLAESEPDSSQPLVLWARRLLAAAQPAPATN